MGGRDESGGVMCCAIRHVAPHAWCRAKSTSPQAVPQVYCGGGNLFFVCSWWVSVSAIPVAAQVLDDPQRDLVMSGRCGPWLPVCSGATTHGFQKTWRTCRQRRRVAHLQARRGSVQGAGREQLPGPLLWRRAGRPAPRPNLALSAAARPPPSTQQTRASWRWRQSNERAVPPEGCAPGAPRPAPPPHRATPPPAPPLPRWRT